jgi:hypothetical protein
MAVTMARKKKIEEPEKKKAQPPEPAQEESQPQSGSPSEGEAGELPQIAPEDAIVSAPSFLTSSPAKSATINPLTLEPRLAVSDEVAAEERVRAGEQPEGESESVVPTAPVEGGPDDIYANMGRFFAELQESFSDRYEMWEQSINAVLLIMRKAQGMTIENSQKMVQSIEDLHKRVTEGLEKFEKKRNAVEEYSGADLRGTVKKLKEVMSILKLQVQEYDLKNRVDTYLKFMAGLS